MQIHVELTESERQTVESAFARLDAATAQEYRNGGANGLIMALLDASEDFMSASCYNDIVADCTEFPALSSIAQANSAEFEYMAKECRSLADTISERLNAADKEETLE